MFDTSSLPTGCTISSAKITFTGSQFYASPTPSFNIVLMTGGGTYPSNPIVSTDYNFSYYSGNGGSISYSSWPGDLTFNSTGISWIKDSDVTRFMLMSSKDISSTSPSQLEAVSVDSAILYITHTGGTPKTHNYTESLIAKNGGSSRYPKPTKDGINIPNPFGSGSAKEGLFAARSRRTAFKRNSYLRQMD